MEHCAGVLIEFAGLSLNSDITQLDALAIKTLRHHGKLRFGSFCKRQAGTQITFSVELRLMLGRELHRILATL